MLVFWPKMTLILRPDGWRTPGGRSADHLPECETLSTSPGLGIQEPILYDGTIRENILLELNPEATSDGMIVSVCKSANIYDFILSLPYVISIPVLMSAASQVLFGLY